MDDSKKDPPIVSNERPLHFDIPPLKLPDSLLLLPGTICILNSNIYKNCFCRVASWLPDKMCYAVTVDMGQTQDNIIVSPKSLRSIQVIPDV